MNKKKLKFCIFFENKNYPFTIQPISKKEVLFKCEAANIDQGFLKEDIAGLLIDLPELIIEEQNYQNGKAKVIRFRISDEDKKVIKKKALAHGYSSVSTFLRALALGKG